VTGARLTNGPMDMTGRRILVTGASSGIGRETAILLSRLHAAVVLSGRNEEKLGQTLMRMEGDGHLAVPFDMNAVAEIPNWVKGLVERTGPFDAVVHAAGQQQTSPLTYLSSEALDGIMRLAVTSALMLARGFSQRGCASGNASIVFVSSIMGTVGKPFLSAYSAAKAALSGATRSLALELAPRRIRVNCVAPAFVQTEMLEQVRGMLLPEQFEALEKSHPLGFGTPLDVAHAIAFLVGDTGRWITGSTLVVDGGYSAQ